MSFESETTGDPVEPREDRVHSDNYVLNELKRMLITSRDAFGKQIADGTTNEADIAGHYQFNPERLRCFVNGTRQFIQYGSVAAYEDVVDGHLLKPQSSGDVVTIETTEKYRYVVGYIIEPSLAFRLNQDLQAGDALTVAYGDADLANSSDDTPGPAADGWIWYSTGADAADEGTFAIYRNGTEEDSVTTSLEKALTILSRVALPLNWYNVGKSSFIETHTADGEQFNTVRGSPSVDDGPGAQTANKAVQLSIKAGSSSTAGSLQAKLGSIAVKTLGDVEGLTRTKTANFIGTIDATETWVPVHAIRVDPSQDIVNAQLTAVDIMEFTASADVRVLAVSFDPSKLADSNGEAIVDSDFSTPTEHTDQNSAIQETSAVDQFPDSTGTVGTSATDPGGWQVGYASLYTSGESQGAPQRAGGRTRRRQITDRDIVVFLGFGGGALTGSGDVTVEYTVEQDW